MQSSEKCDAILRADQYGYGAAFAHWRKWEANAPPRGGALRTMVTIRMKDFSIVGRIPIDARLEKTEPPPPPRSTMAKTPVVPLLLLNSMIVPVGWQRGSPANPSTAKLSSMRANGGLRSND
jgi:hypothetical protein